MTLKSNNHEKLTEKRCNTCNSLLAKVNLQEGSVEIKCNKCGNVNTFITESKEKIKTFGSSFDVTVQQISKT